MPSECEHLEAAGNPTARTPQGCEECLKTGGHWVHLRLCLTCGHVGCCDSSPGKHATKHFHATQHPAIRSFQPGETWRWCYVDEVMAN
ncbi:MAG: UBP-type zinc finger domain-containing protein [Candidatus Eremiobacteraeota bacterium]|nr:UBP-type zinc finger domain-containing protein [Candidatus Eremiobacteraeota bacterium]